MIIETPKFSKRFQNVFRPHENKKPEFSNPFMISLKSVSAKRFRVGLVWTVGLENGRKRVEIKLRFEISPS